MKYFIIVLSLCFLTGCGDQVVDQCQRELGIDVQLGKWSGWWMGTFHTMLGSDCSNPVSPALF